MTNSITAILVFVSTMIINLNIGVKAQSVEQRSRKGVIYALPGSLKYKCPEDSLRKGIGYLLYDRDSTGYYTNVRVFKNLGFICEEFIIKKFKEDMNKMPCEKCNVIKDSKVELQINF